uniref:Uncharacterized protein n=1 Tax=Arundo donax TaxID=35708 RepID=A0A0A9B628_ARUDO
MLVNNYTTPSPPPNERWLIHN